MPVTALPLCGTALPYAGAYAAELRHVPFSTAVPNHCYQLQDWADQQVRNPRVGCPSHLEPPRRASPPLRPLSNPRHCTRHTAAPMAIVCGVRPDPWALKP